MGKIIQFNREKFNDPEYEDLMVKRLLKMVLENDRLFTLIEDDIIQAMILSGYIEVDLDNETIEGTKVTPLGLQFINTK